MKEQDQPGPSPAPSADETTEPTPSVEPECPGLTDGPAAATLGTELVGTLSVCGDGWYVGDLLVDVATALVDGGDGDYLAEVALADLDGSGEIGSNAEELAALVGSEVVVVLGEPALEAGPPLLLTVDGDPFRAATD